MMKTKETEGPRGFAVLLQHIDDGGLHTEISEAVQSLTTNSRTRRSTRTTLGPH